MSGSESLIQRTEDGPVVVLTLNRPERRNALGSGLIAQLSEALSLAERDPRVRAVVLTGAGPSFCAGMDLKEAADAAGQGGADLESEPESESEQAAIAIADAIADLLIQVQNLSKPTIAALNGDALAGGAGLALACDFVIASESATLGYPEVRRGLVAAMVMHSLVRQAGVRRAWSLLLTGAPINAVEAERWGLINCAVPAEECLREAVALGHALVACAPEALATTKRLIAEALGGPFDLRGAAAISAQVRVSDEAQEGIRSFLERRPPAWASAGPSEG